MAVKIVFLTTTSATQQTWTSPSDFPTSATVEIIGAGGAGVIAAHGGAGGGGAYATKVVFGMGPNTVYQFMLNAGGIGSGTCWIGTAATVAAANAANGSGITGGAGGLASACVPTASAFSGGSGGTGTAAAGACGGGGSAGPSGAGKDGGTKAVGSGGSGGGGSNGGTSTAGVVSASSVGGAGGNGTGGTGGGAASTDGTAGTGAGGGGASTVAAGNGATSAIWTATAGGTAGPGGGGGGGSNSSPSAGGDGGLYGGGAGATGLGTGSTLGTPGQGLIVITYTPAVGGTNVSPTVTGAVVTTSAGSVDTSPSGFGQTTIVIATPGTGTWLVPSGWNSANNSIVAVAGGGGGANGNGASDAGGGGSYATALNVTLSVGANVSYHVGLGGNGCPAGQTFPLAASNGADTWFGATTLASSNVGAKGGIGGSGANGGGQGGIGTSGIGSTRLSGGAGGITAGGVNGGGGAGGLNGVGGAGAVGTAAGDGGNGGGGGGSGGGTAGSAGITAHGGNGGDNFAGTGHGIGAANNLSGGAGSNGGGGGGGGAQVTVGIAATDGGSGGSGVDLIGGGGGGAGWGHTASSQGGDGGLYGGGGGAGGTGNQRGGNGAGGVLVITYTPDTVTILGASAISAAGSVAGSLSRSAAVTGGVAATSAGTVGVSRGGSIPAIGASVATSAGAVALSISASVSPAVTGATAATAAGAVGFNLGGSVAIAGAAANTAPGSVGLNLGGAVSVFGASATLAAGGVSLSLGGSILAIGASVATSAGTVGVSRSRSTAVTGVATTAAAGAVGIAAAVNASPPIAGARATSAAGGVGAAADVNASPAIIGAAMTAVAGNITPSRNLRLKPLIRGLVTWEAIPHVSESNQVACFNYYTDVSAHPGIFAAVQIQAGWWQLEPSRGTFTWDVIETALSNIRAYNAANPATPLVARMNIYPCQAAPDWAKNIGGPPLSVSVTAPGGGSSPITCGRFWTSDYIAAWVELLTAFAARYDSEPLMADIINTGTGVQTNEMWHQFTQSADIGVIKAAGYTDAQRLATINAAAGWHSVFTQTRFVQTMNEWHPNDKGVLGPGSTVEPLAALTAARAQFGEQCIVSQASFNSPLEPNNSDLYPGIEAAGTPFDLTPQAPQFITDFNAVVNSAVSIGANSMDLWPIPTGWLANTDSQLKLWAAQLIANPTPSGNADVHGVVATASAGSVSVVTNPTFAYGIWCCHGAVPAAAAIYANPMIAGVSISLGWADIQPTAANAYDWSLIDGEIAHAVASGKQISIEIKVGASAPAWLFDTAGAPSISFKWWPTTYGPPAGTVVRAPLPWDSIFRNAWLTFIAAMGAKYATSPTVSLIKVTGININTGELLLPYDMNGGTLGTILPSSDWAAAGYTPNGVLACFEMFADAYTQAFPRQVKSVQTGTWAFPPIDNSGTVIAQIDRAVVLAMQTYHANADPTCWLQANGVQAHWIYTRPASLPNVMLGIQAGGVVSDTINCKMNNGQKPCDTVQMTIDSVNLANGNRVSFLEWFQSDLTANNADENAALANFRPYQPGVSSTNIPGAAAVAHAGDVALRYGASPAIDGDRAAAGAGAVALSLSSSLALTGAAAAALAGAVLGGVGTATSVAGAAVTTAAGVVGLRIDGSAAIFGASATALHGAVNLSLGGAAAGAASASSAGTVVAAPGKSIAGASASGAAGTVAVRLSPAFAITGTASTAAAGIATGLFGIGVTVGGSIATAQPGVVAATYSVNPSASGASAIASAGAAGISLSGGVPAAGAAVISSAGIVLARPGFAVAGAAGNAVAGLARPSISLSNPVFGAAGTSSAGAVAAMPSPQVAGGRATAAAGNPGPAAFAAAVGASAISLAGLTSAAIKFGVSAGLATARAGVAAGRAGAFPEFSGGVMALAGRVGISRQTILRAVTGAQATTSTGIIVGHVTRIAHKGAALRGPVRPNQTVLNWIPMMAVNDIPPPVWMPAMRAGETDGRYFDCTPDLGPTGDVFTSILSVSIAINRQDGAAITVSDLQSAGIAWPDSLDATRLIPTFGFTAPLLSSGVAYNLVLTANPTAQGRVFIRDWMMLVATALG